MLKPQIRPLRPRQKRTLIHWATELIIVVTGVLLALVLAEWVTERREQAKTKIAIEAMNREIAYHMIGSFRRIAAAPCLDEQISTLAQELPKASISELRGLARQNNSLGRGNFEVFYGLPTWTYYSTARDRALRNGAFDRLSPEIAAAYADTYRMLDLIGEQTDLERLERNELSLIAVAESLDDNERVELLKNTVRLDVLNNTVLNAIGRVYQFTQPLNLEPSEEDREAWRRFRAELRETRGECVLDIPLQFSGNALELIPRD